MGMYIYISEEDRESKREVEDIEVNEAFQEALKYDVTLMIEQSTHIIRNWFRKNRSVDTFQIYHESSAYDKTAYQARYQFSGSGEKRITIAYLHGIINGGSRNHEKN